MVSTHDIEFAIRFADKIWLLSDGALSEGRVDELSDAGVLQRFIGDDGIAYDKENKRIEITEI